MEMDKLKHASEEDPLTVLIPEGSSIDAFKKQYRVKSECTEFIFLSENWLIESSEKNEEQPAEDFLLFPEEIEEEEELEEDEQSKEEIKVPSEKYESGKKIEPVL